MIAAARFNDGPAVTRETKYAFSSRIVPRDRSSRTAYRDVLVALGTHAGLSAAEIALGLGCTERAVVASRARIRELEGRELARRREAAGSAWG